ncbi:unnamed protein product [Diamesa hyperborea]
MFKKLSKTVSFSKGNSKSKTDSDSLEAVVGFQIILNPNDNATSSTSVPELEVNLIGARHLPSSFGLKTVEGYLVKVKMFPGSTKYDSAIQTTTWPKFNENFKFPLVSPHKSSFKMKNHQDFNGNNNETLPQRLFKGNFVVFTVFALLELPPGSYAGLKGTYKSLKRQGSILLRDRANINILSQTSKDTDKSKDNSKKLTPSESQRNIGSVTCFLDPKIFEEKNRIFTTAEMWMPIKDITITPSRDARLLVNSSPKGQVEMVLELSDLSSDMLTSKSDCDAKDNKMNNNNNTNPFELDDDTTTTSSKSRFSLPDVRKLIRNKRDKPVNGLCLKITTSKMKCSIKVKEEFENNSNQIYVKTTVFEHDILSGSWKSDTFSPTLSIRWNDVDSTITIPLVNECSLENVSIKTQIATKTKLGKKVVLGTVFIGPDFNATLDQWNTMASTRNKPVPMWYSYE